ncbi:MAG: putative Ig domain-containing protein [Acidobacteria bacterium]|nr:putative Ig domain-containing protein [Acidobacteriota bacterium]
MTIVTPLQITTLALPPATWGQAYSFQLQASGGSSYVWNLESGSLPTGLTLSSSGLISGTLPSAINNNSITFTVSVRNSSGQYTYKQFTLTVQAPIVVGTNAPSSFQFTLGQAYVQPPNGNNSMSFFATGGTPPYSWVATGLPSGLRIDGTSGFVVGTPAQAGAFPTVITATDSTGRTGTTTFNVAVVTAPLLITNANGQTPATLPSGTVGVAYNQYLVATGGSYSGYQWTVQGALPQGLIGQVNPGAGCTSSCSFQITGTPTQFGTVTFTVQVKDSLSNSAFHSGDAEWNRYYGKRLLYRAWHLGR